MDRQNTDFSGVIKSIRDIIKDRASTEKERKKYAKLLSKIIKINAEYARLEHKVEKIINQL